MERRLGGPFRPRGGDTEIGGNIALLRTVGGFWRAKADETENYIYAIALS
jgi:hypothetical protein